MFVPDCLDQGCSHFFSMRATYKMNKSKWSASTYCKNAELIFINIHVENYFLQCMLKNFVAKQQVQIQKSYGRLNARTDMSVHRHRRVFVMPMRSTHSAFESDWSIAIDVFNTPGLGKPIAKCRSMERTYAQPPFRAYGHNSFNFVGVIGEYSLRCVMPDFRAAE